MRTQILVRQENDTMRIIQGSKRSKIHGIALKNVLFCSPGNDRKQSLTISLINKCYFPDRS